MEVIAAVVTAVVTLGVVVAGFIVWSVIAVARRAQRRPAEVEAQLRPLEVRAGSALVRLDDAIHDAADELGFALAQFGPDDARAYRAALDSARADAREAFALQQRLDDGVHDTERQRREWTERILALCARASETLAEQDRAFESRRRLEVAAPQQLARLGREIDAVRDRLARALEAAPQGGADPRAVAEPAAAASALLDAAASALDDATLRRHTNELEPVGERLHEAHRSIVRANGLVEAIDRATTERADATARLAEAVAAARAELDAARALRDEHEVPAQRDAVNAAIAELEQTAAQAAEHGGADPGAALDRLLRARARLDSAAASARNAEQRLTQARSALAGALRQAESHIAAASDVITANRGRVGADARTRLAEANRQLDLARDEADPVAALDAARRASSRAQDADALARYDAMHR